MLVWMLSPLFKESSMQLTFYFLRQPQKFKLVLVFVNKKIECKLKFKYENLKIIWIKFIQFIWILSDNSVILNLTQSPIIWYFNKLPLRDGWNLFNLSYFFIFEHFEASSCIRLFLFFAQLFLIVLSQQLPILKGVIIGLGSAFKNDLNIFF